MDNKKTILLLSANPTETTQLNLAKEVRGISEQLQMAELRDDFELKQESAVRIEDLRRAIFYNKPYIIHFSGHGLKDGLILEDNQGEIQIVPTDSLSSFFSLFANQVECVVLNSCYSESQAKAISKHIKYVIGMRKEIGDDAAIQFSKGFYEGLGAGLSIEEAFISGQSLVQMYNLPNRIKPILHIRNSATASLTQSEAKSTNLIKQSFPLPEKINIFFSYAPEDAKLCKKIDTSLAALERLGMIESWSKREIPPGDNWSEQIDSHINDAQIILLLVSDDFIASNYCYDLEMERAMERHEKGEARVIPILLRECLWQTLPFAKLRALPANNVPICSWDKRDKAFYDVASGIRSVIEKMRKP